jgi:hypothetical protein
MIRMIHRPLVGLLLGALSSLTLAACSSDSDDEAGENTFPDPSGSGGTNTGSGGQGLAPSGSGGYAVTVTGGTFSATGGISVTPATGGSQPATGGSDPQGTGGFRVRTGETCEGYAVETDPAVDPDVCVGSAYGVEPIPVDMYIMMDRTSSMTETLDTGLTRWEAFRSAMDAFVNSERAIASPVRVGFGFFSYSATLNEDIECNPNNYATPLVPIGDLEETGPLIMAAIEDMTQWVGGWTPTYAALQGALQYAGQHQAVEAGRVTVVLLVTDGLPTQCSEQSMQAIAELAGRAFQDHGVLTFVIGLSPGLWNLNQIAQYGGTIEPTIVDSGGDASQRLLDAILNISSTPLGCEFEIPTPTDPTVQVDHDKVRVLYHPATGGTEEIPRLSTPGLCADSPYGGWFYDSEVNPTSIRVCDCNCNRFGAGIIEVTFGCEPKIFVIP